MINGDTLEAARPLLRGLAGRLLRDPLDIEDCVQSTMLLAWERRAQFAGTAKLSSWLGTICRNCALSMLRARASRIPSAAALGIDQDFSAASAVMPDDGLRLAEVRAAIGRMRPDWGQALLALVDHGEERGAAHLGISVQTLKTRAWRARTALREDLQ